jgi:hypothetical protein
VLWVFLLYKFFDFSSVFQGLKKQLSFNQLGLLCSALVPFLYVFSTLFYVYKSEKLIAFPWSACLSLTNIPKNLSDNGVLGIYDYKCEGTQTRLIHDNVNSVVNRFYYINAGLFLLIIMIYNNTKKQIFNDKMLADWSLICLFIGILGTVLSVFDDFLFISIMFLRAGATLLTMLNASFGIVLFSLMNVFF